MLSKKEAKAFQEAIRRGVPVEHAFSLAKTEASAFADARAELRSLRGARWRGGAFKPLVIVAAYAVMILVILPVFALYVLRETNKGAR